MTAGQASGLVWTIGALALVGGALLRRHLPIGQAAKMGLGWLAIFVLIFGVFAFRNDAKGIWSVLKARADPEAGVAEGGVRLRIPMAEDGHFWVRGAVNGAAVRFLVDSGATTTALSVGDARAAGIDPAGEALGVPTETANGTVIARRVTIARLTIGPIGRRDLVAVTAPEFGETTVLGMNFLSSLRRWGVEGDDLILEP